MLIGANYEHHEAFPAAAGVRKVFCERLTSSDRVFARPPSPRRPTRASWRSLRLGERPLAWLFARHVIPGSLIYDSTLCDCVDDNQHAEALDPAASEFQAHRGQCICSLNNNYVPRNEFLLRFRIEDHIRLLLTDTDVTGGLIGVRF